MTDVLAWSAPTARTALDALPADERLILPALQAIQAAFGHVPSEAVPVVADFLNVSVADTHGVLTFYHDLRRTPPAAITLEVCTAEACQACGARELRALAASLEADDVEVREVRCFGNCALGPTARIGATMIGRASAPRLQAALDAARAGGAP